MTRVLIIGLDGATFSFIDPLADQGRLPNLQKLLESGVRATLRSTIPPASCPAWDSFITGKNPGKLGVYDVFFRKAGSYETARPDAADRKGISFWNLLPGKSIIMNIPMTFPPEKVNGILIAGRGATEDSEFTYPPEVRDEINRVADGYIITPSHTLTIKNLIETTEKQARVVSYLMDKEWDLFVVNFLATDVVCHGFWGTGEVEKAYERMDRIIGDMLKKAEGATVIVMSDHGVGPPAAVFWPNSWLQHEGFLKLRSSPDRQAAAARRKARIAGFLERARLVTLARAIVPRSIRSRMPSHGPSLQDADVDWENTIAYSIYGNMPRIFLNLKGREPRGCVEPQEYEAVRERIIQRLKAAKHALIKDITIYRREEIYSGVHLDLAPDLLVQFNNFGSAYMQPYLGSEPFTPMKPNFGWHHPEGVFIMAGDGVRRNARIPELSLMDIAPLVLHILSVPIPRDMDGTVRKDVFEDGSTHARRKVAFAAETVKEEAPAQALTQEQEEKILRQLKSLGYS